MLLTNLSAEINNHQDLTFEVLYDSLDIIAGEDSVGVFNGSIVNISSSIINLAVVRRLDVNLEGWTSSICIGSLCYSDWVDSVSVNIESEDTASIGVLVWTNGSGNSSLQLDLFNNNISDDNIILDLNIFASYYTNIENESLNNNNYITVSAYPNPFNPSTQINYDLAEGAIVLIDVRDLMGRNIKLLVNGFQSMGYHSVRWDATNHYGESVSAGIYFYTIQVGKFRQSEKMLLLK